MSGEPHLGDQPVPTPYLVIPYGPGDDGSRPIAEDQAYSSGAIHVRTLGGNRIEMLSSPRFELSCDVMNSGPAASTAALIEFYVGGGIYRFNPARDTSPTAIRAGLQLIGRARFVAPPGRVTTVTCPQLWSPGRLFPAARNGILVEVYDLFTDRLTAPFDAVNDRHVARVDDPLPGVGQVWTGRPTVPTGIFRIVN